MNAQYKFALLLPLVLLFSACTQTTPQASVMPSVSPLASVAPSMSPSASSSSSAVSTKSASPAAQVATKLCESKKYRLSSNIPKDWTCASKEHSLEIKSAVFDILISNLGGDGYCNENFDKENCKKTSYYKGKMTELYMYNYKNENKQLKGYFLSAPKPTPNPDEPEYGALWVSITYKNMETKNLTAVEKKQLTDFVDSVIFK